MIKPMGEDGACLFRAVADQVYGDQEMHGVVRKHCMDYIVIILTFYLRFFGQVLLHLFSRPYSREGYFCRIWSITMGK